MAVTLANLVDGFNRHVCCYTHTYPGYTSSSDHGASQYKVDIAIPADLKYGQIAVSLSGYHSGFASHTGTAVWSGNPVVYRTEDVAGTTISVTTNASVQSWSETGGGDNSYTMYGTSAVTVKIHYTGFKNVSDVLVPEHIPQTDISTSILNAQLRREPSHVFSMNEPLSRVLANKPSGPIAFSDYKGKYLVECRIPEIHYRSGGWYGSGTTYSSWSTFKSNRTGFGMLKSLHVYVLVQPSMGNADAMGFEVRIANKADTTKYITIGASYGSGGNSSGTYVASRNLTADEISQLGGTNTELVWSVRTMGNTGNSTLVTTNLMILTPGGYDE